MEVLELFSEQRILFLVIMNINIRVPQYRTIHSDDFPIMKIIHTQRPPQYSKDWINSPDCIR